MELRMGSGHLSDQEFVAAFESCKIPGAEFHHADHVRLALLYVREHGEAGAETRLLSGIRKTAVQAGSPQKFHHTMTVAWLRLVAAAHNADPTAMPFGDWAVAHPALVDKDSLLRHYSKALLDSAEALNGWVAPDLLPLVQD